MLRDSQNRVTKPSVPKAYEFLYTPCRYKVVRGGRGKGASWSFARVLIYKSHVQKKLILCTREIQKSIGDSVHRLICDQIRLLGYSEFFHITQNSIKNKISGSEFVFRGLNDLTVDSIKSFEGVDIIWVAEAHNLGDKSWRVLTPTIRSKGSEIWVDYNPDHEDAPTHRKFTKFAPRHAVIKHINFDKNPWFPAELEEERQEALDRIANAVTDDDREQAQLDYNNVWLGEPRKINKASIFGAKCVYEIFDTPDDAVFYHGVDWGYANDPTVMIRCFESPDGKDLYIDREAYGIGVELDDLPNLFDKIPTARKWKIYADSSRPETISHVKRKNFDIYACDKWSGSVEDGIEFIKSYRKIIIHKGLCLNTQSEAKNYSWKVDKNTGQILPVPVDAMNHCWDAIRYALNDRIKRKPKGFFD